MSRKSKRVRSMNEFVKNGIEYSIEKAIPLLKEVPAPKFEQTVDVAVKLGIDPRKSCQVVRGVVSLPYGTGKNIRVLAFAKGDKVKEVLMAGADYAGFEDLFEKVKGGWLEFDAVVATPDLMREVGKLGKILGPRNLMPTPRVGTVTNDLASIIPKIKAGQIEFKNDRYGVVNAGVAKLSFPDIKIIENVRAFARSVVKNKPSSSKGVFLQQFCLSSTMGPGLMIDIRSLELC